MKFICSLLILLLPMTCAFGQSNETPNNILLKYRLIKVWSKADHKKLIETLKVQGNSLPLETLIVSDSTVADKNDNLPHSWSVGLHRQLAAVKVDLKEQYNILARQEMFGYGQIANKNCLIFNANLDTTDYISRNKEQVKLGSLVQSQITIDDNYGEPTTMSECNDTNIVKIAIDYMLFADPNEVAIKIQSAVLNKKNNVNYIEVFNVGKKEQLMVLNPNVFRKDISGKVSYLYYLFYINLDN